MNQRVVIVTGAASGNGLAIASRQLAAGDFVVAFDLSAQCLAECEAGNWAAHRGAVLAVAGDVSNEADIQRLVDQALSVHGRIDVLINNAGITGSQAATDVHTTSVEEFDRVMAINVRGVFLGCRAVLPHMLGRRAGVILNIASVASFVAFPKRAAYTTSKGAVVQLTRSIAVDYARSGIRCNALCPGMIETPMTQWRLDQPDLRAQVLSRIPQNEIGTPGDVAAAAEFLVSDNARYVNGAALVMDGGLTAA
ncbi:SDR family NAD(P)-dependent oxidoreductase [Methylibium sp.]|uniref:SDR family NAD(P)-dependent oxidoreductase n=1 Tax=Methylibium sp. TaxID=2067992 RepID=UPI003D0D03AD